MPIAIVAFVEGTMYMFFNVAELGALALRRPARQLPAAAAAEQARYATVTLVAPPLGGALFGLGARAAVRRRRRVVRLLARVAAPDAHAVSGERERKPGARCARSSPRECAGLWSHRFFRACALLFSWTNLIFEALFLVLIVVGRARRGSPAPRSAR